MQETNDWTARGRLIGRRRFVGGMVAGLAGLGLAACGGGSSSSPSSGAAAGASTSAPAAAAGTPKPGGRLVLAQSTGMGSLDPQSSIGSPDHPFLKALYDSLIRQGDDFVSKADWSLAQSWEIKDDGKQILLRLRPGVTFHDGTPFNAEAAKWNIDHFIAPDTVTAEKVNVEAVTGADVVDAQTVSIRLKRPSASVLMLLGDTPGQMVSPAAYQSKGKDTFRRNPVGTGPFKFKEWVQDDHITVVRNENYWRKPLPYLEEIRWNFIRDATVHLANLETGTADMADILPANYERVQRNANLKMVEKVGTLVQIFYLNTRMPPFDEKNSRLAFNWAFDRDAIVKGVLRGRAVRAVSPVSPAFAWAYTADVAAAPGRDNAKVKDFLRQAGHPNGFDFTVMSLADYSQQLEAVQAQLAESGIKMNLQIVDVTTYLAALGNPNGGQAFYSGIPLRSDPTQLNIVFHSTGTFNPGHAKNDVAQHIDDLLLQADSVYELEKRRALYLELTKIVNEEALYIPTWNNIATKGMHKKVEGWSFGSTGAGRWEETWSNA